MAENGIYEKLMISISRGVSATHETAGPVVCYLSRVAAFIVIQTYCCTAINGYLEQAVNGPITIFGNFTYSRQRAY